MRIGQGYDVHQLVPGRQLVLGGVTIDYELGLLGHSDADVLLHAICDALLGAVGLGDIGRHFPDSDATYKGCDSRVLLRRVMELIGKEGYLLGNIDATIVCQQPKLAPHIPTMMANIAADCRVPLQQVNVKATTTEQLGFCGRGEGIAAYAVALINRPSTIERARRAALLS
ncbi:2-C-methyl-D-erythritol 2,4-cyclodiphosphate synthase [Pelovirga terrestris]|uniref:2-C-methyl-D-erythritol 2,4-cyclodiphosphate synthase n=1 Tax=Pelovirga terrestris TaxID=2771352 RepID=A0A8J6UI64_9BACT|nr:2-C-methyl-D-erythritol 2,4-cyclodiphosphate synthase [Pelovirga terrestris]MBD1400305.1 2-C-methyl-D-erythritol 2,4-cyclodiphosphate synthase [Pelovirga terrestris]